MEPEGTREVETPFLLPLFPGHLLCAERFPRALGDAQGTRQTLSHPSWSCVCHQETETQGPDGD